jgi:hypothetical protein
VPHELIGVSNFRGVIVANPSRETCSDLNEQKSNRERATLQVACAKRRRVFYFDMHVRARPVVVAT